MAMAMAGAARCCSRHTGLRHTSTVGGARASQIGGAVTRHAQGVRTRAFTDPLRVGYALLDYDPMIRIRADCMGCGPADGVAFQQAGASWEG